MDIRALTAVFKWCTIINAVLLMLSILLFMLAPDFVYSTQSRLFPISRDAFNVVMYGSLGFYKIIFLVFNLVPWAALVIVGRSTGAERG